MPEQTSPQLLQKLSIPIAIVIAGVLIAGAVYLSGNKAAETASASSPTQAVNVKDVKITAATPYIGNKNALVTLAYWSDYQCPFCKAVEVGGVSGIPIDPSMPTLIKDYVDTGKLRIVFKDYAFLGNDSVTAAEYEHAIWETYPDKFYAWRDAMYKAQDEEGDRGFGNEASILQLIKTIPGMDANKLKALVAQNKSKYDAIMQADQQEGASFGIQGTPGFITGTQLIAGAEDLSTFQQAINSQLK